MVLNLNEKLTKAIEATGEKQLSPLSRVAPLELAADEQVTALIQETQPRRMLTEITTNHPIDRETLISTSEPVEIIFTSEAKERSPAAIQAARAREITKASVNDDIWGHATRNMLNLSLPAQGTEKHMPQIAALIQPLSTQLTDLSGNGQPIRQVLGGIIPKELTEEKRQAALNVIVETLSVIETEPAPSGITSPVYRRQMEAETLLDALLITYAETEPDPEDEKKLKCKRDLMGQTSIPEETKQLLQEQITAFSQPELLSDLMGSGLVSPVDLMKIKKTLTGNQTLEQALDDSPQELTGAIRQTLKTQFRFFKTLSQGTLRPDDLMISTRVMLENIKALENKFGWQAGNGGDQAAIRMQHEALKRFKKQVIILQDQCAQALGKPCLQSNQLSIESFDRQTLEPIPLESTGKFGTSARLNTLWTTYAGAVNQYEKTNQLTQERETLFEIAPMARQAGVAQIIIDGLERMEQETKAVKLSSGTTGIAEKNLDTAMARLYSGYDPKEHRHYLEQAIEKYPHSLDDNIPVHVLFEAAISLSQDQGVLAEYQDLKHPVWAAFACASIGQTLSELSLLPPALREQYAFLFSLGGPISVSEILRVSRKARREQEHEFTQPVSDMKEARPIFRTDKEITGKLKPHFPGQEDALEELVRACLGIQANVSKKCGYEPLEDKGRKTFGKKVVAIVGPTGSGKTSALTNYLRRAFPDLDFYLIPSPVGIAPDPWKAKTEKVLLLEAVEMIQGNRGISFQAALERARKGHLVMCFDNFHHAAGSSEFQPAAKSSELQVPAEMIQNMLLPLTGNEPNPVMLERQERTSVFQRLGSLDTQNTSCLFLMSGEGPVQDYAKQRIVAETGNPLADLPSYVHLKQDDLGRIFCEEFAGRITGEVINFNEVDLEMTTKVLTSLESDRSPLLLLGNTVLNHLELFRDHISSITITPRAIDALATYVSFAKKGIRTLESAMTRIGDTICRDYDQTQPYNDRQLVIDEALVLSSVPQLTELPELKRKLEKERKRNHG